MRSNNSSWILLAEKIRKHVADIISQDTDVPIDDQTELLQSGILTSLSLISILAMIEKEAGSRIVNDETEIEDFSSLEKILKVARKAFESLDK